MIVSYNWLKELIQLNVPAEKLAEEMSLYSVEVESFSKLIQATNLVVGYVKEKRKHENSDHLNVCQVHFGDYDLQIVCGAPNVEEGQHVIVALPGAVLPGGTIKKSVIRGVESNGMICSLQELGLDAKYIPSAFAHGIYVLGEDAIPGTNALTYLGLDDDVIELGLTPNRMDLLSMKGVAKDVKAMYQVEEIPLSYTLHEDSQKTEDELSVSLETSNCYSYYARVVKNVVIQESPTFIKARLIASGIRPINNVVDITNYILMLFGQPLHAFDQDQLGHRIVVRRAKEGEKTITLDQIERTLTHSDIVITDGEKPVCIAGVMGSNNTEVTEKTVNVVLESAVFRPLSIRKTSSRLGLRSEASIRYERGVDLNQSLEALDYACYLLEQYAGGTVLKGYIHQGVSHIEDKVFTITPAYVEHYLGINIPLLKMKTICESLSFGVAIENEQLKVSVPNRRLDITIQQDLVEEIARIYGYDQLQETLPLMNVSGGLTMHQKARRIVRHTLKDMGWNEVITYSLIHPKKVEAFGLLQKENETTIELNHPMSEEHAVLRKSLISSLVEVVKYNRARKIMDNAFFEIGKKYYRIGEDTFEETVVSGIMNGVVPNHPWASENKTVDFFYVKGILERMFANLRVQVQYKGLDVPSSEMHPKRTALLMYRNQVIGFMGELHPKYAKEYDLGESYVFEILLDTLLEDTLAVVPFQAISKVPSVERDLALVMDIKQPVGEILEAIRKSDKMISKVQVFDLYIGDKIEPSKKSVAVRITLESDETLTDEIISSKIKRILKSLEYRYQITLRA
ncbi:MAG: phenylalanine--tRNA ligase subunit beta [Anaeroplasma bactoclasticum]|nr:phenylalanine--tRNA ligase subunit beta [Anaeroplasma bactoclasticum]